MKNTVFISMLFFALFLNAEEEHLHEHSKHEDESIVMKSEYLKEFSIETDKVKYADLSIKKELAGEVTFNENSITHIVPIISGIVEKVYKNIGDKVKKGERLALIRSKELADLKLSYLEAKERKSLALINFEREKRLREQKINTQKDFLNAKNNLTEVNISLMKIKSKLLNLGLAESDIKRIKISSDLGLYIIKSPVSGDIIKKHITKGEYIKDEDEIFMISDLSTLWINLTVYSSDLSEIKKGARVFVNVNGKVLKDEIDYITPFLDENTRTATARVVIKNKNKDLFAGMFVTCFVEIGRHEKKLIVKKGAIQKLNGKSVVFVKEGDGFKAAEVRLGLEDGENVEVLSGLKEGMEYVVKNSFLIKSEMQKENFSDAHHH